MDRIRIALNIRARGNYAFFCPTSRLHVTRSNPIGYIDKVTPQIFLALKFGSLIDVDGRIDMETGLIKPLQPIEPQPQIEPVAETQSTTEEVTEEPVVAETVEPVVAETVESDSVVETDTEDTPKKGRKKKAE